MVGRMTEHTEKTAFCAGGQKCLSCAAQFNWLALYTWVQADGSVDFYQPRTRPEGLEIHPSELPPWGSPGQLDSRPRHHSDPDGRKPPTPSNTGGAKCS